MNLRVAIATCIVLVTAATLAAADENANLVPNPGFEQSIEFHPKDWKKGLTVWRFYEINLPIKGGTDSMIAHAGKRSYRIEGTGKAFLHSGFFEVKPSTKYKLALWCREGAPEAEVFWWVKEGVETDKRKLSKANLKKTAEKDGWTLYQGEAISAPDAKKAYIRIIAQGNLCVDDVSLMEMR